MKRTTSNVRWALIAALLLLGLSACGADDTVVDASGGEPTSATESASTESASTEAPSSEDSDGEPDEADTPDATITGGPDDEPPSPEPPPVVVTRGSGSVALDAWTYCWTPAEFDVGICADGEPPAQPPLVGGDGPIILSFGADFTFSAQSYDSTYTEVIGDVTVDSVDGGWELTSSADGPSIIEVFGRGPEGDVSVSFAID